MLLNFQRILKEFPKEEIELPGAAPVPHLNRGQLISLGSGIPNFLKYNQVQWLHMVSMVGLWQTHWYLSDFIGIITSISTFQHISAFVPSIVHPGYV